MLDKLRPWPVASVVVFVAGLAIGHFDAAGFFVGLLMAALLGLPCDCFRRCGRVSTAFTWMLLPWSTAGFANEVGKATTSSGSLFYVPWMPELVRHVALIPGFLVGLVLAALAEWAENRTGKRPTLRPMQVLAVCLFAWLGPAVALGKALPQWWQDGNFILPLFAAVLGWLTVRVVRTVLQGNAARQRIEARRAAVDV